MIVGLPKRTLLALPRVLGRKARTEPLATARPVRRPGPFATFAEMMERHADLVLRGLGD